MRNRRWFASCALVLVAALGLVLPDRMPARAADVASPLSITKATQPGVATVVSTNITTDTTWTAGNTYQVAGDVSVAAGVTLTITPGVLVQFQRYAGLTVYGKVVALGDAGNPITFTADFAGASPQAGWWGGLSIVGTAAAPNHAGSKLSYVTVEYGGYHRNADLYLAYGSATVTHSVFRHSSVDGIYGSTGGVAHLSDTSFANNQHYAVYFSDGSVNPVLARLAATGNGTLGSGDGVALGGGTLAGVHVWEAAGLPYFVTDSETVAAGATLTVQPGTEVRFGPTDGLMVQGRMLAIGTASQPITLTRQYTTPSEGYWNGLVFRGTASSPSEGSILSYVTVEYGGWSYANVEAYYGKVAISHSILRYSRNYGFYASAGGSGSTIEASQIVNNIGLGVRNAESARTLMAANNWWGSVSGPTAVDDNACNPGGTGSKVSAGVGFQPYLTSPDAEPGAAATSGSSVLSLAPQRWYVPADGVVRAWVKATLRSGAGLPLPGRTVRLQSTLGTAASGGVTDAQGQVLAYVTSVTPGDADLTASLVSTSQCEATRSPAVRITFTPVDSGNSLLDAAAPYMADGLEINPEPITQGVPTRLRAQLHNPNSYPISVNATFGIAQLGLGLAFGPVGEVLNQVIPANGDAAVEVVWTPPVGGHYCVRIEYSYVAVGGASAAGQMRPMEAQRNLDVQSGAGMFPAGKEALERARAGIDAVKNGKLLTKNVVRPPSLKGLIQDKAGLGIPDKLLMEIINWDLDTAAKISQALGFDPPRQDYKTVATPEPITFTPLQPGAGLPAARAVAANGYLEASLDLASKLRAALLSLERSNGAAAAKESYWAFQQAAALTYYKKLAGAAMIVTADRLDVLIQELKAEGIEDITVTADAVREYQQELRTQGFSAEAIQAARIMGLTDAEIEAVRQERIAANPDEVAGSVFTAAAEMSASLRSAGNALTYEPPPMLITGGAGGRSAALATAEPNNLYRVYATNYQFAVGNPLTQAATVELRPRPLDLPEDWMVTVTPLTVTLQPGEVITAMATVRPGLAAVQGTQPRLAVEGYANGQLLGGVVLDVLVPRAAPFDGKYRTWIPEAVKSWPSGG